MERIKPAPQQGFALINGSASFDSVISELGIFGYVLSDEKSILANKVAGYLLRTKVGFCAQ